ncbi:formate dehydrogenase accessory sulfurtransferase FdhD [Cupriavidus sp. AU9028]|uniref:formate dehydrogenase accessory sulfurtransferase FdhD n=1 Tax=Cupriavidus sp. AU9028 TaxID=2871157 RepID=UPI001C958248|nr:formate dehydrogenase accessory sulfurtransferase FdhD [Cupriavidus sp. AU9028]MBY4896260.1 formate dehydrogenase accessory sulfurtransferase FdhD [Cupriavidus sp. AU9028]
MTAEFDPTLPVADRAGYGDFAVTRYRRGARAEETDTACEEFPVALVFNGLSHAVMMATPRDLEALAVGFALTEGIVPDRRAILDYEAVVGDRAAEVRLSISQGAFFALKARRRSLAGRTGCGLCGIESLAMLDLAPERVAPLAGPLDIASAVARAARELPAHQALMARTGGMHAAAWCDRQGRVLQAFEDVGRHNALDKLIGARALRRQPFGDGFVFLSSRASYELVRKAARVGIPMLATISAPTSLAIDIARQAGMTLASFCRQDGCVVYADGRQVRPVHGAAQAHDAQTA